VEKEEAEETANSKRFHLMQLTDCGRQWLRVQGEVSTTLCKLEKQRGDVRKPLNYWGDGSGYILYRFAV